MCCYALAGPLVRFIAVEPRGPGMIWLSDELDLRVTSHRLQIIQYAFQLYRVLQVMPGNNVS